MTIVDGATGAKLEPHAATVTAARGELVKVRLPNGPEWVARALGVWRAGATRVPINVAWTARS
jgi:acyl-CoA synthetase (AMP-forming)/AMP-acid ligase II